MKILVTESSNFAGKALTRLQEAGFVVDLGEHTYDTLAAWIGRYDGLLVRLGIKLDANLLAQGQHLKFIATTTTGLDHIDVDYAESHGIKILSLQGEHAFLQTITPTAELALIMLLMLRRNIVPALRSTQAGVWDRSQFFGDSLFGARVGIVGLGRLGGMMAQFVGSLGAEVRYFDPYVAVTTYVRFDTLADLASWSDAVSVHIPLTDQTRGMFDRHFFGACQRHAYFINTSRGDVVNEQVLLEALQHNWIAGAGLDVLTDEVGKRAVSGGLIRYAKEHTNLLITPHIGGATHDALRRVEYFLVGKILEYDTVDEHSGSLSISG